MLLGRSIKPDIQNYINICYNEGNEGTSLGIMLKPNVGCVNFSKLQKANNQASKIKR